MRKTLCPAKGSSGRKGNAIPALEDIETFVKAANGRLLAGTLCDPLQAGIGMVDEAITRQGQLSIRGDC